MSSLLHAAQLAVDAASKAVREGERAEPHLCAARYFLDLATDGPDRDGSLDAETATAQVLELRQAMHTSAVVEQAKGVLMLKLGLDERQSFQRLVRLAERGHGDVTDIARAIVAQTLSSPAMRRRAPRSPAGDRSRIASAGGCAAV
jgi:hypothetical protein